MAEAEPYPVDGVRLIKNVRIPTRSGLRLAANLYLPDRDDGRVPVVMEYSPYRKDDIVPPGRWYDYLVQHGYAVARVDTRGTGGSEGSVADEYTTEEQLDGCDAVDWLATQPWCDGHVTVMGPSYGAFTALQIATHQPAHLTSIIPVYFTDDCHYRAGLLRMYYDPGFYGCFMVATPLTHHPPRRARGSLRGRSVLPRLTETTPAAATTQRDRTGHARHARRRQRGDRHVPRRARRRRSPGVHLQVEPTRPETTLARSRCVARRAWDGFAVEATSAVLPTGNRTHFHITIDLEVRVNGAHHFNKRWAKTIERKLL